MLSETQIGEVWLNFVEYIDKKQLDAVAERYVEMLVDFGVTDRTLQNAAGVDTEMPGKTVLVSQAVPFQNAPTGPSACAVAALENMQK